MTAGVGRGPYAEAVILDSRLTTRVTITRAELDRDRPSLDQTLIEQLKTSARGMGATVDKLTVETFTPEGVRPEDPDSVYLCAHFTGGNRAEVIGGAHDGAQIQVDKRAPYIRIPIDPTVDPARTPLTDENSRWYSRAGISDATGYWAYLPSSPPAAGDTPKHRS